MTPSYRWIITRDRGYEQESKEGRNHIVPSRVGTQGPSGMDPNLTTNSKKWSAWDDDKVCNFEGYLYGEYGGFEPLDDFCMADTGCTGIKMDGEYL